MYPGCLLPQINYKQQTLFPQINHSPRGLGQDIPCHRGAAIPAVLPRMLSAESVQPKPGNSTKSRASKLCVAKLHPGTTMGKGSRSWEPKGAQFRWDDILQCGSGTGCSSWCPVAGMVEESRMKRSTSTEAHSTMSRQSGRGTEDQESVSAAEMALGTARGDQQQIMDKAHITEVPRSACPWAHE